MSENLEKTYNPKAIEAKLYEKWCDNKYFHAEDHQPAGILLRRRWVETRQLGKSGKMSGILLCLRRNRTRIICYENDHSAFDSDVLETHQRIGSNI